MPQLWMTYQELADIFGGSAAEARMGAINSGWVRKKSRDSQTRVLLPAAAMQIAMAKILDHTSLLDAVADLSVSRLRAILPAPATASAEQRTCRAA